jgi:hypothetical protein
MINRYKYIMAKKKYGRNISTLLTLSVITVEVTDVPGHRGDSYSVVG